MRFYCVLFLLALPGIAAQYETKIPGAHIAAIASDRSGAVYVTGSITTTDLPTTTAALQVYNRGGVCGRTGSGAPVPCSDAFLAKLNADGSLAWATYLGGAGNDAGTALAVDRDSGVWVTGTTASADFTNTGDVVQPTNHGPLGTGSPNDLTSPAAGDVFIMKISPGGDRVQYATFLGGNGGDIPKKIVLDPQTGNVCVAGSTGSGDFPRTDSDLNSSRTGSFVTLLSPTLKLLVFSVVLDANVADVAVSPNATVYITGWSKGITATPYAMQTSPGDAGGAFAARIKGDGTSAMFVTYMGGTVNGSGLAVVTDLSGTPWIVLRGTPTGTADQFGYHLVRLDPSGARFISTERVGAETALANPADWSLLFDSIQNRIWMTGSVSPSGFMPTTGAIQTGTCSADVAYFLRRYASDGTLQYSSFQSAPIVSMTTDAASSLYAGRVGSVSKPLLSPDGAPIQAFCTVNSASFRGDGLAPGEAFTVFGVSMGPQQGVGLRLDPLGKVATNVSLTRVLVNDIPAPLLYTQAQQINAMAPYAITPGTTAKVVIEVNGVRSQPLERPVLESDPGIFIADVNFYGQGAIHNEDGRVNNRGNAAFLGSVIAMWVTGTGLTDPLSSDGVLTLTPPWPSSRLPIAVVFAQAVPGEVQYQGAAPGLVAGLTQINVRLPDTLPAGTNLDAVPISIRMGNGSLSVPLATVATRIRQ